MIPAQATAQVTAVGSVFGGIGAGLCGGCGAEGILHLGGGGDVLITEHVAAGADVGQPTMEVTQPTSGSTSGENDILLDDLSLPPNPVTGSSSVIIGMGSGGKLPSDSDAHCPRKSTSNVAFTTFIRCCWPITRGSFV